MAKIRTEFIINKYNLSNTVESLLADPSPVHLKNKRKSFGNRHSVNYKTTENVEFLKEVIIKFNFFMFLALLTSN